MIDENKSDTKLERRGKLLTTNETEQLVSLRIALEDSLFRAKNVGRYRGGSAIVALDAVVERASWLVMVTRGLKPPKNGTLDDYISQLVQNLKTWKPTVLADIKQPRRARNSAQHDGLEPNVEQIPIWAHATQFYATSLIDAEFGVDLQQVVLSDAIQDETLRGYIFQAEEYRNLDDYENCVKSAKNAYTEALTRWRRLKGAHSPYRGRTREIVDRNSHEFLSNSIKGLRNILDGSTFAFDEAEVEWFMRTVNEPGDVLDDIDADRALAFSFQWIVKYERAATLWIPNRRYRADVAARLVRTDDSPAYIKECVSVEHKSRWIRAELRIANVPDESEYGLWSSTLRDYLPENSHEPVFRWLVLDSGTVWIDKEIQHESDFTEEIQLLADALVRTHAHVKEKQEVLRAEELSERSRIQEMIEQFENVRSDLPRWITKVDVRTDGVRGKDELELTVSREVMDLDFNPQSSQHLSHFRGGRKGLTALISDHNLVSHCYIRGSSEDSLVLDLAPLLTPEELVTVFGDVSTEVEQQLGVRKQQHKEHSRLIGDAKASIEAQLARHQRSVI